MRRCALARLLVAAALLLCGWAITEPIEAAGEAAPKNSTPASRVEDTYRKFLSRREAEPTNLVVAWQFAAACFDKCEFSRTDSERAEIANQGITACQWALSEDPRLAPAHYYLGMDLAQLARTKLLGALSLLDRVEHEWMYTIQLDENFDYAGGERNLGLLYLDAPGWPVSLGDRGRARQHLLRAVNLHPEYPENHLNLIEAYLKWHDRKLSIDATNSYVKILGAARVKFAGPDWESAWDDWDKRWQKIQSEMGRSGLASPYSRK